LYSEYNSIEFTNVVTKIEVAQNRKWRLFNKNTRQCKIEI